MLTQPLARQSLFLIGWTQVSPIQAQSQTLLSPGAYQKYTLCSKSKCLLSQTDRFLLDQSCNQTVSTSLHPKTLNGEHVKVMKTAYTINVTELTIYTLQYIVLTIKRLKAIQFKSLFQACFQPFLFKLTIIAVVIGFICILCCSNKNQLTKRLFFLQMNVIFRTDVLTA